MSTQSHTYRSKVKRLTTLIKSLYPTLRRIPAAIPPLNSEANRISPKLGAKEATARKEAFGKLDKRLDKETVRYWLQMPEDVYTRKSA